MNDSKSNPEEKIAFQMGQIVRFAGAECIIRKIEVKKSQVSYFLESKSEGLPIWIPQSVLVNHQLEGHPSSQFNLRPPHVLVVDNFFRDPDEVHAVALAQRYREDLRFYKGKRSELRYLWPGLREEFSRLLNIPITTWIEHGMNGVFQQTNHDDPLVWHHDSQMWAAAIYLTPDPPANSGTSFWRDKTYGCRRMPMHPFEQERLGGPAQISMAEKVVYDPYHIEHQDNWELVESVAGLYNRLVIWDAKLFHSATSYEHFGAGRTSSTRLVQLFFFDTR
jgi:hypothetical protein